MIFKQHLLKDGYSSGIDYQQEFEGAPIYSIWLEAHKHNWYLDHKAQVITDATQWNKKHPRRHKRSQKKYRRTPRGKQKAKARRDKRTQLVNKLLRFHRTLPGDWNTAPADKRMIATLLIENPGIRNKPLGKLLDRARNFKCSYGDGWEEALSRPGRAANYISEIRKWVNQPGKRPAPKPPSITQPFTA